MIQCVSDSNPYDDEPDPIEEAENWLKEHPDEPGSRVCSIRQTRMVIEMLLAYIDDEI